MKRAFIDCLLRVRAPINMVLPEECMNIIAEDHQRWENTDVNEYGYASAVADWMDSDSTPCDSLMDFMHRTLPLAVNPRDDRPNTVFLYWADFHRGPWTKSARHSSGDASGLDASPHPSTT